jgi:mannitol/fructose-specific phosphotransferase system IIA component
MSSSERIPVLDHSAIVLGRASVSRDEAITDAGDRLVARGLVKPDYVAAMLERETTVSTFMGNGVALPHGTFEAKDAVLGTGIVVVQYPDGVEWPNGVAHLVVGLAAKNDDHVVVLSQLAEVLQDEELCEQLWRTDSVDFVFDSLTAVEDE